MGQIGGRVVAVDQVGAAHDAPVHVLALTVVLAFGPDEGRQNGGQ
jgi:hypothetical protein